MVHYTSIEQSKKLLELGLSPETSDMWWLYIPAQGDYIACAHEEPDPKYINRMEMMYGIKDCAIPCWSVGALLSIMPEMDKQNPTLEVCHSENGEVVSYIIDYYNIKNIGCSTPIDACFEMVCWLLENKYITGTK